MKQLVKAALVTLGLTWGQSAFAQGPVETFVTGCETEIGNFCSQVTPGDGRIVACIYAHSDTGSIARTNSFCHLYPFQKIVHFFSVSLLT